MVFSRGISHALRVARYAGGHIPPKIGLGLKLEWKNAQKNAKKNITSETINKITPNFNPDCTDLVCWPSKVPSRIISRHQVNITNRIVANPKWNKNTPPEYPWKYSTNPKVSISAPIAAINGQGDGSTRWKLCLFLFNTFRSEIQHGACL